MKQINIIFIITLVFVAMLSGGCEKNSNQNETNVTSKLSYEIISSTNYDSTLCSSTSSDQNQNGFNSGFRIILKDKLTDERLNGSASISFPDGSGGSLSLDDSYTCEEQTTSKAVIVFVYSKGYSPLVFKLDLTPNKLETIEVFMIKSCSGAPSCFDNLKIETSMMNTPDAMEKINSSKEIFFNYIQEQFGLNSSDYQLSCMECELGRGGYIKAKGTYKDNSPLELYYHWGWCSSGGSDCGSSVCLNANNEIITSFKNNTCNKLYLYDSVPVILESGAQSGETVNELTNETIKVCFEGGFEDNKNGQKSISIIQYSSRYNNSVKKGNTDCLNN